MIGDWVLNGCGNLMQVTAISEDGIDGVCEGGEWCDLYDVIKTDGKEVQGEIYASNRRTYSQKRMMYGICIIMRRELQKYAMSTNCKT